MDVLLEAIRQDRLGKLSDTEALDLFSKAFEKEFEYLKYATASPESGTHQSAASGGPGSPSEYLFKENYVEVNRTSVGMLALKWTLGNDYASFTSTQKPAAKLTQASFEELRKLVLRFAKVAEDTLMLLISLIINDLGKSSKFAEEAERVVGNSVEASNHDEIVYVAAKAGIIPCLGHLDEERKQYVLLGLQLGAKLSFAQFAQAESVPGNLKVANIMKGQPKAFDLKFLETIFDVAGAAANADPKCAKAMVESVFQTYMIVHNVLHDVVEERGTLRENYDRMLTEHGTIVARQGFRSLSVSVPEERALLRLMVMGRSTFNKDQAQWFEKAFNQLPEREKRQLVNGLNVDGVDDGKAILPYYMPALFAEALKNTSEAEPSKVAAIQSLMRFLARVYGNSRAVPGKPGKVKERDLMFAAETIRSPEFKTNPSVLDPLGLERSNSCCIM
ncbi:hypothetical protein CPB86DRAFT_788514 [Serendipita vermifera]|nr:hypothetical protein CPB86DRAFT_788514 [Serendipita vermifera]